MTKRIIWVLTILWMAVIFYFSHQPGEVSRKSSGEVLVRMNMIKEEKATTTKDMSVLKLQRFIRKWAHFIEYFILGILMALSVLSLNLKLSLKLRLKLNLNLSYLTSWILCTIYAATDELHQYFIPGRGPKVDDVILDSISSLSAVILVFLVVTLLRYKNAKLLKYLGVS